MVCYNHQIIFLFRTWTPSYLIYDATRLKGPFTYTESRTRWQPFGRTVLKGNLFKGCSCPPPCRITADPLNSRHISPPQCVLQGRLGVFRLLIRSGKRDLSLEATVTNDALSSLSLIFRLLSYRWKSTEPKRQKSDSVSRYILEIDLSQSDFSSTFVRRHVCDVMGSDTCNY